MRHQMLELWPFDLYEHSRFFPGTKWINFLITDGDRLLVRKKNRHYFPLKKSVWLPQSALESLQVGRFIFAEVENLSTEWEMTLSLGSVGVMRLGQKEIILVELNFYDSEQPAPTGAIQWHLAEKVWETMLEHENDPFVLWTLGYKAIKRFQEAESFSDPWREWGRKISEKIYDLCLGTRNSNEPRLYITHNLTPELLPVKFVGHFTRQRLSLAEYQAKNGLFWADNYVPFVTDCDFSGLTWRDKIISFESDGSVIEWQICLPCHCCNDDIK